MSKLSGSNMVPEFSVTREGKQELSCQSDYMYVPVIFLVILYILYVVECWHCSAHIELPWKSNVQAVYDYINTLRDAMPIVWWKAIGYHYMRRGRQVTRYRNGDSFTSTQVYYERINSKTGCSMYNFCSDEAKDISKQLIGLENYSITQIKVTKGFTFAGVESENEFEEQRAQFFQEHEQTDDYMETREGLDLLNISFKSSLTVFGSTSLSPWYLSQHAFWILSVVLLSWPMRILIRYNTAYVHYHVNKLFGCEHCDVSIHRGYQNQITRVSTMDSIILESAIRNNNAIVPSYSEAMLMSFNRSSQSSHHPFTSSSTQDLRRQHHPPDSSFSCRETPPPYHLHTQSDTNQSISDNTRPVRLKQNGMETHKELSSSDNRIYTSYHTPILSGPCVKYCSTSDHNSFRPAVIICCSNSMPRCVSTNESTASSSNPLLNSWWEHHPSLSLRRVSLDISHAYS